MAASVSPPSPANPDRCERAEEVVELTLDTRGRERAGAFEQALCPSAVTAYPRAYPTASPRARRSDLHLGAELDDPIRRQVHEVGDRRRVAMHVGEQLLAPWRHAGAQRGNDRAARQEVRGAHRVEFEA